MAIQEPIRIVYETILDDETWRQPFRDMERFVEDHGGWGWFKDLASSAIREFEEFDELVRGWSTDYTSSARRACREADIDDDDLCDYIREQYENMLADASRGIRGSTSMTSFIRKWSTRARRITIRHRNDF